MSTKDSNNLVYIGEILFKLMHLDKEEVNILLKMIPTHNLRYIQVESSNILQKRCEENKIEDTNK